MSAELLTANVKRSQSEEPEHEHSPKRRRTSPRDQIDDAHEVKAIAKPTKTDDGAVVDQTPVEPAVSTPAQETTTVAKTASKDTSDGRERSGKVDEKQRSRRLFGSLLGTLGQKGADRTIKKRQEIEHRRKTELLRQDGGRNVERHRDVEQLTQRRKNEQWHVDEEDMRIRHRAMRNTANFLQTKALPRLYYLPWELRVDQERIIKDQRRRVEDQIDDEADEFEIRRRKATGDEGPPVHGKKHEVNRPDGRPSPPEQPDKLEAQGSEVIVDATAAAEAQAQLVNGDAVAPSITDDHLAGTADAHSLQQKGGAEKDGEEQDEGHMVEREEDTVIY